MTLQTRTTAIGGINEIELQKSRTADFALHGRRGLRCIDCAEVKLDRAIDRPDGMRSFGSKDLLIVEGGGPGRLSRITINSDVGTVKTLNWGKELEFKQPGDSRYPSHLIDRVLDCKT